MCRLWCNIPAGSERGIYANDHPNKLSATIGRDEKVQYLCIDVANVADHYVIFFFFFFFAVVPFRLFPCGGESIPATPGHRVEHVVLLPSLVARDGQGFHCVMDTSICLNLPCLLWSLKGRILYECSVLNGRDWISHEPSWMVGNMSLQRSAPNCPV